MIVDSAPRFLETVPGMLTAAAALITAVGGLIAVLMQLGVLDGHEAPKRTTPEIRAHHTRRRARQRTSRLRRAASQPAKPWSQAEAVFTDSNGKQILLRAETVRYCFSGGAGINLNDWQDIPFEKVVSIVIHRSDG
jgi:hypothetical protein